MFGFPHKLSVQQAAADRCVLTITTCLLNNSPSADPASLILHLHMPYATQNQGEYDVQWGAVGRHCAGSEHIVDEVWGWILPMASSHRRETWVNFGWASSIIHNFAADFKETGGGKLDL